MYKKSDMTKNNGLKLVWSVKELNDMARQGLERRVVDIYFVGPLKNQLTDEPFAEQRCEQIGVVNATELKNSAGAICLEGNMQEMQTKIQSKGVKKRKAPECILSIGAQKVVENDPEKVNENPGKKVCGQHSLEEGHIDFDSGLGDIWLTEEDESDNDDAAMDDAIGPTKGGGNLPKFRDPDYVFHDDLDLVDLLKGRSTQWEQIEHEMEEQGPINTIDEDDLGWLEHGDDVEDEGMQSQSSSDEDTKKDSDI